MLRLIFSLEKGNADEKTEHYHALRFRYFRGHRHDADRPPDLAGGEAAGGIKRIHKPVAVAVNADSEYQNLFDPGCEKHQGELRLRVYRAAVKYLQLRRRQ